MQRALEVVHAAIITGRVETPPAYGTND
jgi:hypothetical protein